MATGRLKDTARNIQATGEFVVSLVSFPMAAQMNATSFSFDAGTSEFDAAGVTAAPSHVVAPPYVAGAPVSFECRSTSFQLYPASAPTCAIILGEVVAAHVDESIVGADGIIDPVKLDLVSRMGADWYGRTNSDSNFTLARPAGVGAMKRAATARRTEVIDTEFDGFPSAAFTFLKGLAEHNEREWFEARRETYEASLRVPMKALIEEMDARLATFAPEITGTVKGSMFRIHRDIRFSKNKAPYKTNAACWFFHRDSKGNVGQDAVHGGAGMYFHLEPRACFAGGGVWMPPTPVLKRIRAALDVGHEEFDSIVMARPFRKLFGAMETEAMLKRMPRGFDPAHPAGDWLRYQSFTAGCALTQAEVTSAALADRLEEDLPHDHAAGAMAQHGDGIPSALGALTAITRGRCASSSR